MDPPPVLDVAVHGGGAAVHYHWGLIATLAELERVGACRVRRYYAVSGSAILCAIVVCFPDSVQQAALIRSFAEYMYARRVAWIVDGVAEWLERELPHDAHVACTGRLYVTYIERFSRRVVFAFSSRAELVAAIVASCSLVGICAPLSSVWARWDGLLPLVESGTDVATVWGSLPPVYSLVALNLPFIWWARAAGLAFPRAGIRRALRDGFAASRVSAISDVLGEEAACVVRSAAEAARAKLLPRFELNSN
jgi:hypothetical protein